MSRKRTDFKESRNAREHQLPSPLDGFASEAPSDPGTSDRSVAEAEPDVPLPLADVLSSVAPFEWRDAVAIVLQLVDQLSPDGLEPAGTFPDIHHIALAPSGFLLTQLEPRGTVPLAGLGRLLQQLLAEATPPPPLRLLAIQAASAKPTLSFADLARELGEWARPYRHRLLEVLANLYQRAHDREATTAMLPPAHRKGQMPASAARFRLWQLQPRVLGAVGLGVGALAVGSLLMLGADAREPAVSPARTEVAADGGTLPTGPPALDTGASRQTTSAQVEPAAETRPSSVLQALRNGVRQLSSGDDDALASSASMPSPRPPATGDPRPSPTRPATTASTSASPTPRPSPAASPVTASAAPKATASTSASLDPRPSPTPPPASTASTSASPAPRPSPPASAVMASAVPKATASTSASPDPRPSPTAPPATAAASVSPAVQLPATDSALAGYSTSILREAEQEFRRARALFDERQFAVAADRFAQVVKILDRGDPALGLRSIASEFAGASRALASHNDADSSRVYTSADEGVTEPVTLATLPRPVEPGTPADQRAVLELLIDARGGVESAHLIDVEQHFRDRWWMSAAKAWLFRPAMKDGEPVRFLKRVVFTASDSAGLR